MLPKKDFVDWNLLLSQTTRWFSILDGMNNTDASTLLVPLLLWRMTVRTKLQAHDKVFLVLCDQKLIYLTLFCVF